MLVIEDNPADAKLAALILAGTRIEHKSTFVTNGAHALALLHREEPFRHAPIPDLILLDLRLPTIDGVAVLREIASLRRAQGQAITAVVVLSSLDTPESRKTARVLGADAYYVKPVGPQELDLLADNLRELWYRLRASPSQ